MLSKKPLVTLLLFAALFVYIYSPTVSALPITTGTYVAIAVIFIAIVRFPGEVLRAFQRRPIANLGLALFGLAVYLTGLDAIYALTTENQRGINFMLLNSTKMWRFIVEAFFFAVCLTVIIRRNFESHVEVIVNLFFLLILLQFVLCLIMLASPEFRDLWFFAVQKQDNLSTSASLLSVRGFGISSGYLFSTPIFSAFVLILALAAISHKRAPFIVGAAVTVACLTIIMLNARIGFIAVPIGLIMVLCARTISLKRKFGLLMGLCTLIGLMFAFEGVFLQFLPYENLLWVAAALADMRIFLAQESDDTIFNILLAYIQFPSSVLSLLLGEGRYVFANPNDSFHSDVGYIQQIYFGGLFFAVLSVGSIALLLTYVARKLNDAYLHITCYSALFIFLVAHFKGNIFFTNDFTKALMLFCIFALLSSTARVRSLGL